MTSAFVFWDSFRTKSPITTGADGFQYAFGKGGPAGSLDIDLDWSVQDQLGDFLSKSGRAVVERAAKLWAYGLKDVVGQWFFGPDQILRANHMGWFNYPVRGNARVEDLQDGVRVVMAPMTTSFAGNPGVLGVADSSRQLGVGWDGPFKAYTGSVWLTSRNLRNVELTALAVHELGHVLGHAYSNEGFARYVSSDLFGYYFNGPRTVAANGLLPVLLQSDLSHNASCFSIMGYCHEKGDEKDVHVWRPQDVDCAVFSDMGYELVNLVPARQARDVRLGRLGQPCQPGAFP